MNSKVNAAANSVTGKSKKDASDSRNKQQVQSANNKRTKPSSLDLLLDNRGTTIVTVKTKSRKGGSIMVSSGSSGTKANDEKKQHGANTESRSNSWSRTLREPNPALKQGLQQLAGQMQSSKNSRHGNSVRKDSKGISESHKSPKYNPQDNIILDEIPVKQAAIKSSEYLRAAPNSAVPSATTIASSMESVEYIDRGVQCGFDTNDKFSEFNPVRTLDFLMKEMEGLVKDERSSEILTEMEQALFRIPREQGKLAPADLEAYAKLKASTASVMAMSKKLDARCTMLRQQNEKQAVALDEAQQGKRNLENTIERLNVRLNESQQREQSLESQLKQMSAELNEKNKDTQALQKLINDLRHQRDEQIDLAQQNYMEGQYLKVQNEKLMTLSSYKDTRLAELQSALKALQNHIAEELIHIREAGERAKDANNHQLSLIHGGAACSSPTSTSSNNSLIAAPCVNLSEISLSAVERFSNTSVPMKKQSSNSQLQSTCFNDFFEDTDVERLREKTQLEFISLPGGDTSHTISLSQRKCDEPNVPTSSDNKTERPMSDDRKVEEFRSAPNLRDKETRDSMHLHERDTDNPCSKSNIRKSSSADKKQRADGGKRHGNDRSSGDPAVIKEEFEMMFQHIRRQSKFAAHLPSPARPYQNPEWSDSSVPTVSGISGTNVV